MKLQERIKSNLDTIEKYIQEHCQSTDSVLWQMAMLSLQRLRIDLLEVYLEKSKQKIVEG